MKCKQTHPGFELVSLGPFPTMITIALWGLDVPLNVANFPDLSPSDAGLYNTHYAISGSNKFKLLKTFLDFIKWKSELFSFDEMHNLTDRWQKR